MTLGVDPSIQFVKKLRSRGWIPKCPVWTVFCNSVMAKYGAELEKANFLDAVQATSVYV